MERQRTARRTGDGNIEYSVAGHTIVIEESKITAELADLINSFAWIPYLSEALTRENQSPAQLMIATRNLTETIRGITDRAATLSPEMKARLKIDEILDEARKVLDK